MKKEVLFLREEYGVGFGKYKYLYGEKYEGDWKNGKYHGQGTYTWKDGQKYEVRRNAQDTREGERPRCC